MEIVFSVASSLAIEASKFVYRSVFSKLRRCWQGQKLEDVSSSSIKVAEYIPGPMIRDHSTASIRLDRVIDLLNDDEIRRIGIWGMGGIGKSYLVKNLNNKLNDASPSQQPFSLVIWATVSKSTSSNKLDLRSLQMKIAGRFNLMADVSMERTAAQLFERLDREKRFLLILDDVWEAIDLDLIGIPRPEDHIGSKIILTSRSLDVCREMMTDVDVKVEVLTNEEAWDLFRDYVGEVVELHSIRPLAEIVFRECGKLPLALVTVGSAMRGKTRVDLWEDAINELQMSRPSIHGIEPKVYNSLKLSYDSLQNEKLKSCFLYCCLYPEDYSILVTELVECWWAEGLIGEHLPYHAMLNRGIAFIENLKDSCLLETGDIDNSVKMHDVVRDVAIWIATPSRFLVGARVGMTEILEVDLQRDLERLSLIKSTVRSLPDHEINCTQLLSIFLQGSLFLRDIPETFLQGFRAVRTLNLGGTQIKSLPQSLTHLQDLRALLLRGCDHLEELPPIGILTKLSILDLHDTSITQLPEGMGQLTNLRKLDLSYTLNLELVRAETISRLSSLEVLNMSESSYRWLVKQRSPLLYFEIYMQDRHREQMATLDDLRSLQRLSIVNLCLYDTLKAFEEFDIHWIERLKIFCCSMGLTYSPREIPRSTSNSLSTQMERDLSGDNIEWFISHTNSLAFDNCCNFHEILENLVLNRVNCFSNVKSLTIKDAMVNEGSHAQFDLLPNLQELYLDNVQRMRSISVLADRLGSNFPRLETLVVTGCDELENLLSEGRRTISLPKLCRVRVDSCICLTELFQRPPQKPGAPEYASAPNLQVLRLSRLPHLRCLSRTGELWRSLERLEVIQCPLLKKLPLENTSCCSLEEIRGEACWWRELEWDNDGTKLYLDQYFKVTRDIQGK